MIKKTLTISWIAYVKYQIDSSKKFDIEYIGYSVVFVDNITYKGCEIMARKSRDFLEKLKKKHGVNEIWSWSRYHNYKIDEYGYYLKYIKREKETETNIYAVSGGFIHDCIEKFYNKEIAYENMLPFYEDKLFEMNLSELKYNRSDE